VHYLNLISDFEEDFFRYQFGEGYPNPNSYEDVHTCVLQGDAFLSPQPTVIEAVQKINPDVILANGFISALVIKNNLPNIPLVYLTNSCKQVRSYIQAGKANYAIQLLEQIKELKWQPPILVKEELLAVKLSDLTITHSDLTRDFYIAFFPKYMGKIYKDIFWRSAQIIETARHYEHLSRPFTEREIDVLFVASDWQRIEKNYPFVEKIVNGISGKNIHVVGNYPHPLAGVTHHGLIADPEHLFSLMGNAKTLVCPSVFDAAPAVLFEGAVMGSNIVTSKNCGNWSVCKPELVTEEFTPTAFIELIEKAAQQKLPDHLSKFEKLGDVKELFDLLTITAETFKETFRD
jgi:glycosyltransferase involved in cell wall biosynthesis